MENFDILAANWDNEPRRIERAQVVANEIINHIPNLSTMKGFEYGCGTGVLSFNLQPYLKKVILGDSSEGMLAVLEKKIQQHNISNMESMKIDLTIDRVPNEKYDLIYILMSLHHVVDIDKVIKAFYDCLNPLGYLCIADLDEEDGTFHGEDFVGHNGFNRPALMEKLKGFGFCNVSDKICYEVVKKKENGLEKRYPLFFMIGQKPDV